MINRRYFLFTLVMLGAIQVIVGLWLALSPQSFYESVSTYGSENDHFLRDFSSVYLAMGLGLLLSVKIAGWRVPVLFIVCVQYLVHTLNHLLDIGDAHPAWLGLFNFLVLAFLTVIFFSLLQLARRASEEAPGRKD